MDVGLNIFSVRNLIKTEPDFLKTAILLKEMGYDYMQYSSEYYDPQIIARVIKQSGLPVYLTHVPLERILNDTDVLMKEHESFSCFNIGLGAIPPKQVFDETEFKRIIEKLNVSAKKMKENGFSFFYHNHHFDFYRHGNMTALQYMADNAPYINFTLDTYWMQFGGVDICNTIKNLCGRICCVHLKDYKLIWDDTEENFKPVFAPVGDGTIDFHKVVTTMREAGTKYFFVEQDDAALLPNTVDLVKRSVDYIKKHL